MALSFSPADDLSLALAVAADADLVSMSRFRQADLDIDTKDDNTPVTDADRAVEDRIRSMIRASRPRDQILGEERGHSSGTESSREWVIDPIDGTAGFSRGLPIWATMIALTIDGVPQVGVVSAPALGQRWWAATGHGAWTKQSGVTRQLSVSAVTSLDQAILSYNSLPGWIEAGYQEPLLRLTQAVWRARAIGDFWSYMLVAEGHIDIAGEHDLQPYDIAALWPIVTEAGGSFSDVTGTQTLQSGSALATNGVLHDVVVQALQESA